MIQLNGYKLMLASGPIHIVEVPNTFFNGIKICLATKDMNEVPRLKEEAVKFKYEIDKLMRKAQSNIIRVRN